MTDDTRSVAALQAAAATARDGLGETLRERMGWVRAAAYREVGRMAYDPVTGFRLMVAASEVHGTPATPGDVTLAKVAPSTIRDGELTAAVWYGCEGQRYEPADTVAEAVWHLSTDDRLDLDRLDRADAREVLADRIPAEAQGGGA